MYHQVDQTKKDQILLSYSIFVRNSKDFQYLNDTGGGHFEIGHFLTYAVIPEIPPNTVLKLKVSLTQINSQILSLRRCIRASKAGPGLIWGEGGGLVRPPGSTEHEVFEHSRLLAPRALGPLFFT